MQKQLTGTTTASYVSALDWYCQKYANKTIYLRNTHATLSMYYKLLATYSADQALANADEVIAQTSLVAGADARMQYNNEYLRLILQVIDNSGHATYEIDYSARGN
jgi:hypothetical protein